MYSFRNTCPLRSVKSLPPPPTPRIPFATTELRQTPAAHVRVPAKCRRVQPVQVSAVAKLWCTAVHQPFGSVAHVVAGSPRQSPCGECHPPHPLPALAPAALAAVDAHTQERSRHPPLCPHLCRLPGRVDSHHGALLWGRGESLLKRPPLLPSQCFAAGCACALCAPLSTLCQIVHVSLCVCVCAWTGVGRAGPHRAGQGHAGAVRHGAHAPLLQGRGGGHGNQAGGGGASGAQRGRVQPPPFSLTPICHPPCSRPAPCARVCLSFPVAPAGVSLFA
jgi:hypothetical protein